MSKAGNSPGWMSGLFEAKNGSDIRKSDFSLRTRDKPHHLVEHLNTIGGMRGARLLHANSITHRNIRHRIGQCAARTARSHDENAIVLGEIKSLQRFGDSARLIGFENEPIHRARFTSFLQTVAIRDGQVITDDVGASDLAAS